MSELLRICLDRGWNDPFARGWLLGGLVATPIAAAVQEMDGPLTVLAFAVGWVIMLTLTIPAIEAAIEAKTDD